jgi:hypothetical protein
VQEKHGFGWIKTATIEQKNADSIEIDALTRVVITQQEDNIIVEFESIPALIEELQKYLKK